ncbi:EI24 domain-containing protein [Alteraurantiacibacter aquimixticola]|uniref:EI24 domain-containing protein n=1 Tax=Alteraurantiacibacter aquimixticola TaxID=2489173 RepID=A0A4T3EZ04_9SPHN|nr:EI24 domain-containing protein [Alteraurantiacibacter aquimixticola]TIX49099.1 hypothetical protein E5222_15360 [Alteraurantiacibacter aquimixticola]
MSAIITSFALAMGQLADGRVLRILLKSVAVTIIAFVAMAAAGWYAFDAALAWLGLGDALFAGAGDLRQIASILLALTGLWLVWRVVAMAVIQFYAEDVVHAVEARHYPMQASAARELTRGEQVKAALGAGARALIANLAALPFALALLFTGIGTALLFWLVNALLIGREMQDMVWLRHAHNCPDGLCPVSKFERFALGGVVAALLALPFINFLAPVLGAAGATHLVHRKGSS